MQGTFQELATIILDGTLAGQFTVGEQLGINDVLRTIVLVVRRSNQPHSNFEFAG